VACKWRNALPYGRATDGPRCCRAALLPGRAADGSAAGIGGGISSATVRERVYSVPMSSDDPISSAPPRRRLAYFISIRTYGTWLHGDGRGSVETPSTISMGCRSVNLRLASSVLKDPTSSIHR